MTFDLSSFVSRCEDASRLPVGPGPRWSPRPDAQARLELLLREAIEAPAEVAEALQGYSDPSALENLVVHRSEQLTLLHGLLPPGFAAAPHNHNLWSVIAVYDGQEDNVFFERSGGGLKEVRRMSLTAPGVLVNAPDVIHSIRNPLDTTLRAIHAYGGDLFATQRSNWHADTHEETAFDWRKVAGK